MHLRVRIAVTVKRGWSGACNVRESLCVRVHTRTHTHAHTHTHTHTHTHVGQCVRQHRNRRSA